MTTVSPEQASRVLHRLMDRLEASDGLRDVIAEGVLRQAQDRAAGKPTPQARMAAEAMVIQQGRILSLSGGPAGEVAVGSEFGSTIYRQFGPRNTRGYWLLPSVESPDQATIQAGEAWLDLQIEASVRGI